MEHFCDNLFQLIKHGTSTLHAAFIFLFCIERRWRKDVKYDKASIAQCRAPQHTLQNKTLGTLVWSGLSTVAVVIKESEDR